MGLSAFVGGFAPFAGDLLLSIRTHRGKSSRFGSASFAWHNLIPFVGIGPHIVYQFRDRRKSTQ
jgi:hypothetical protein